MTGRKPKRYSEARKSAVLAVLALNGGDVYRTSKETGIPHGTLSRWARLAQAEKEVTLNDRLEQLSYQLVLAIPDKLDEANLHQLTEALKFVLDKIGQKGDDTSTDARERLIRLLDHYAEASETQRDTDGNDGG